MSDFLFARSQMAMSLAFHIIFAALGIGMPLLMAVAEGFYLRTGKPIYLDLSKRWAKGTAILFAIGAVSGTVLSFELGLLWPKFMAFAGAIIGMLFFIGRDPLAAMLNPASLHEVLHMTLAAYVATGFAVAAVHAYFFLKDHHSSFHRHALGIALTVACISIPLQLLSGDFSAKQVARLQPAKFAALESHFRTSAGAPIVIGGIPNNEQMKVEYGIEIPYLLSLLAHNDPTAQVIGLDAFPREQWPNTLLVHWSFDIMVSCGMAMLALAVWAGWLWWRKRRVPENRWFLRALVAAGPLGFIAIETGWMVTELGRQPWIIYGVLRTADAVTPMPGLVTPFVTFTVVYIFLTIVLIFLLKRQFLETADSASTSNGEKTRSHTKELPI